MAILNEVQKLKNFPKVKEWVRYLSAENINAGFENIDLPLNVNKRPGWMIYFKPRS